MFKKLRENTHAMIDLGVIMMIGIAFIGLMVMAYLIFTTQTALAPVPPDNSSVAINQAYNSTLNITRGFDDFVGLFLIAITIFILAVAISALLILRRGQ